MSRVTGEQLYEELCRAAERSGKGLREFVRPLFRGQDINWKIEQLRIARQPAHFTIARIRALIAGEPIPERPCPRKGIYDPSMQQMTRAERARLGLPPSRRQIMEADLAHKAKERRQEAELAKRLAELAHVSRRPGQTLADRVRELRQCVAA